MQDASSHHDTGVEFTHSGRARGGWVLGIVAVIPVILLVIVAYGFATNVYIDGEALFLRVLIGFLASVAVFMGLLAAALIRSGKNGADIDRVFTIGMAVALLGAFAGLLGTGGSAGVAAITVGVVGFVMMGYGVIRT